MESLALSRWYLPMRKSPMHAHFLYSSIGIFVLLVAVAALLAHILPPSPEPHARYAAAVAPFIFSFNTDGTLYESGTATESTSPYWWLNSGGKMLIQEGAGSTVQGDLPLLDKWRLAYALYNPVDTDQGKHPQNIFRLLTKYTWSDARAQALFKINKDNWSTSPNRNASNGLLLMSRYQNGDTLYYAGLRVDGNAVIKKKYRGTYYTMAEKKQFAGTYISGERNNLLPHNAWIGLRVETDTLQNGEVALRLYMQQNGGEWKKILEAVDDGVRFGKTPAITNAGLVGIRTDFMDISFDAFRVEAL